MAYPGAFQMAYKDAQAWQAGDLTLGKLIGGLMIDTKSVAEYARMLNRLEQGKLDEFAHEYASIATRNANGRYATILRSANEQSPGGRTILGLLPYPRIAIQAMVNNGIKPAVTGYMTGNGRMFVDGMKSLMKYFAGTAIVGYGFKKVTGRFGEYAPIGTPLSYAPMSPGISTILEWFESSRQFMNEMQKEDGPTMDKMAKAFVSKATTDVARFIPMTQALIYYMNSKSRIVSRRILISSMLSEQHTRKSYMS
jgi:hypothetical protein